MRTLLDVDRQVVASYDYGPFGEMVYEASVGQPFNFSTKRYYSAVGLNYFGYRFYNPGLGRWMNRDPLGEAGGINLYGFVGNSPVNWVDPWGLDYVDIGGNLGVGAGINAGVMISNGGIYPYFGGGLMTSPGISITYSPFDCTDGPALTGEAGYFAGGQVGYGFGEASDKDFPGGFWGAGFVFPGASFTLNYVFELYRW